MPRFGVAARPRGKTVPEAVERVDDDGVRADTICLSNPADFDIIYAGRGRPTEAAPRGTRAASGRASREKSCRRHSHNARMATGLTLELPEDLAEELVSRVVARLQAEPARRFLSKDALASHLGVSARRVKTLREHGLPARKIGRDLYFDVDEVNAWLEREGRA